ncbi:hypothetical protein LCGC14_1549920, partial [marine sediment metagenome]
MSLTQSEWTKESVNGFLVLTCTVLQTSTETDAYTLKTPANTVDGTRPWRLSHTSSAAPETGALPVDIWIGYDDDFALSGQDTSLVAASGAFYKSINDEGQGAVLDVEYSYLIDPNLGIADIVALTDIGKGYKVNVPAAPYYAFNFDGTSVLADAVTTT